MSGKVKMRCARCGKSFKSVSAKHSLCQECEVKERAARAAGKATGPKPAVTPAKRPQPTIVGPGASILVPELAHRNALSTPEHSSTSVYTNDTLERHQSGEGRRGQHSQYERHGSPGRISHTTEALYSTQETPDRSQTGTRLRKEPKEARPPKAPTVSREQVATFLLTDELRARIEARYQELAQPVEFDGIRTQIATELGIPKPVVKRTVANLRKRLQLPSWWELQAFTGNASDLERIRAAYLPSLPVPEVGVHKHLALQLGLDSGSVYQGIRRIRAEMHLPQYNPPEAHGMAPASSTLVGGTEAQ